MRIPWMRRLIPANRASEYFFRDLGAIGMGDYEERFEDGDPSRTRKR